MVHIDVKGMGLHIVLNRVAGTNDYDVQLTDAPGVAKEVGITVRVSSTELKQVLWALAQLAPPTTQEQQVMNQWAARVP